MVGHNESSLGRLSWRLHSFFWMGLDVGTGPQLSLGRLLLDGPSYRSEGVWIDATISAVRDSIHHTSREKCKEVKTFMSGFSGRG